MAFLIHELGDERDCRFTVTIAGVPTNPDELTFEMREPDGLLTTYVKTTDPELEAVNTGIWRVLWLCRKAGMHRFGFFAGGNVKQVAEYGFLVLRSKVRIPNDVLAA